MSNVTEYIEGLLVARGDPCENLSVCAVSGGDTHECYRVRTRQQSLFLKLARQNSDAKAGLLASEAHSLQRFNQLCPGFYPVVQFFDAQPNRQCLALSYHRLQALDSQTAILAAKMLVAQHRITKSRFGWPQENFIGRSLQTNDWSESWSEFFAEQRLIPQLNLARQKGLNQDYLRKIEDFLDDGISILQTRNPEASLVHGDLWSGNVAHDLEFEKTLLFDPAPYYGDREVDIAMTRLFGGFPPEFYIAYQQEWPLEDGYAEREAVYNLYHALNHFNLFGPSYERLLGQLLLETNNY